MIIFIIRRILQAIPLLVIISIISFAIIKLPPTDYLDIYIQELKQQGNPNAELIVRDLRIRYGLDLPAWKQYLKWIGGILRGDFGVSFDQNERPVSSIIRERLPMTIAVSIATMILTYIIAIPIGVFCATHQYSWADHALSFVAFIGIATPSFLLALIVMFLVVMYTGQSVGGLFSPEFMDAPWSWAKFVDFLSHVWVPVVILGLSGTAGLMRIMRSNMLETMGQQYITTARAKGVKRGESGLGACFACGYKSYRYYYWPKPSRNNCRGRIGFVDIESTYSRSRIYTVITGVGYVSSRQYFDDFGCICSIR